MKNGRTIDSGLDRTDVIEFESLGSQYEAYHGENYGLSQSGSFDSVLEFAPMEEVPSLPTWSPYDLPLSLQR